jgi:hypothetical protein
MRTMMLLPILLASVSATAKSPAPVPHPPLVSPHGGEITDPSASPVCRDRIDVVRESRGLPKLRRDTTAPAKPLFIAAVDKRIGGCSVLVMRNNTSDVRPLPQFQDGPAKMTPLAQ